MLRDGTSQNGFSEKVIAIYLALASFSARSPSRCVEAPRFAEIPPNPIFGVRDSGSALLKGASPSHSQSPHRAPNSAPFREPTPAPSSPDTIADAVAAASTVSPVRVAMDGGSPIPRPTLFPSPHQFQCANWGCYTRPNSWLLPPSPWISPSACFRLVVGSDLGLQSQINSSPLHCVAVCSSCSAWVVPSLE